MRIFVILVSCLLALSVSANERLQVVTSFSILADFTAEIGGEHVQITNLVGADEDAHVYQPTPDDARALLAADLVIANGLDFEPWLARLMKSTESPATYVVATRGVLPLMVEEAGERVADPHAWQSLAHAEIYVANIASALIALDPGNAAYYQTQRDNYLQRVKELLTEVRVSLARLPASQRKVITSHDAFGYLGQAYGLQFIAPQGLSTHSEPSAAEVAALIRQIRADQVRAVFVENIRDPRLIKQIAEEAGAQVGGTLYSDALAGSGPASSYLGMYRHNVQTLVEALGQ